MYPYLIAYWCIWGLLNFQATRSGIGFQIIAEAEAHIGKPYKTLPLDSGFGEELHLQTGFFDCVTFVEVVLAKVLARMTPDPMTEEEILQCIRYRNGAAPSYSNRLHYFSEWLYQAEKENIGKNISLELGGKLRHKEILFMTKNQSSYPGMANWEARANIADIEKKLSGRACEYIPVLMAEKILGRLQNGDIIAFTSSLPGLDINHTGFVRVRDSVPYLLHASIETGKVEIHKKPLLQYLNQKPATDGFIVFRVMPDGIQPFHCSPDCNHF